MHQSNRRDRIRGTLAPLMLAALAAWPARLPADPPVEGRFREITGTVRFDNADPEILGRLRAPGNEGMSSLTLRATSLAPNAGLIAQVNAPVPDRVANPYQLAVQAGTNAATAIAYGLQGVVWLHGDRELFYTRTFETAPLVEDAAPLPLDLAECVGMVRFQFVDAVGTPITVAGGSGQVYAGTELRAQMLSLAPGSGENFLVVPAGVELLLNLQLQRGADLYRDQINHTFTLTTNVPCDTVLTVPVVLRDPTSLGRITGAVDMQGEFELSTGPSAFDGLLGRTAVIATGPAGNRRLDLVAGDNALVSASGSFELENLLPSDVVTPAEPWRVQAQMHFGTGTKFEWFVSPALGEGANPGVVVAAGGTVDLGDRLRFKRGTIKGRVKFAGPPDTAASRSALNGILRPDDYGVDAFGIPVSSGLYGITASHVVARGQDVAAPGATFTAAGGRAAANFGGKYDPGVAAFRGDYEIGVGGLNGEPSVWKRDLLALTISTLTNLNTPYVNQVLSVTDRSEALLAVAPGETVVKDLGLGFSEVCLRFRTPGRRFYNPVVAQAHGEFQGGDFENLPQTYAVIIEAAYGLPASAAEAADSGILTLVLPQGSYRLTPSLNVLNDDGTESITQLEEITLEVPALQRICVEGCLRLSANIPPCAGESARITGGVQTCGQPVKTVTYQLDDGPHVVVCTDCGANPALDFTVPLTPGAHLLTVTATDEAGAVSSVSGALGADTQPPVIVCPGPVTVTADAPCGTVISYVLPVHDNCDATVVVVCTPPSGTAFPLGTTEVFGVATDAAGNRTECRFTVTVLAGDAGTPTISRFDWAAGIGGQPELIITGANFLRADEVWLGDTRVTEVRWLEPGELRLLFPDLPPGLYNLTLRRCGEVVASRPASFSVVGTPTLSGVEPGIVSEVGNTYVTLRGSYLTAQHQVRVGFPAPAGLPDANLLRNITVSVDGTSLTGIVPALPPGELPGLRSLLLEDANGFVLSSLVAGLTYVNDIGENDLQVVSLRKFQRESRTPATVRMRDGFPSHLGGRIPVAGETPLAQARSFARDFRQLLRVSDPDQELFPKRVEPGPLSLVTLSQTFQGIPVFGAEVAVHLADGEALNVLGFLLPTEELAARLPNITPTLSAEQAEEIVRAARAPFPSVQLFRESSLAIYDRCVFAEGTPLNPNLVWRVAFRGSDREFFVDAHTGEIVHRRAVSATDGPLDDLDLDLQDAENEANAFGDLCFLTSNDTFVADEDGIDPAYRGNPQAEVLFQGARDVYSFYRRHFGRDSYDGSGAQFEVFMNSNMPAKNGARFVNFCGTIEIYPGNEDRETLAHEFTHGVINYSSELEYENESGALNEHYADIMAVLMDRELGAGNWTLSEKELSGKGAIRDLSNPGSASVQSPQPAHYRNRYQVPAGAEPDETNDQGGVHRNSGIANLASYRLTAGALIPANTNGEPAVLIAGIGEVKARQLFYVALTSLPDNATFAQAREAEIFLADFFAKRGLSGFTAGDVCDVRNAWASVGVWASVSGVGAFAPDCDNYTPPPDDDGDGVINAKDNCPRRANPKQEDRDRDGVGDVCDNCQFNPNPDQKDLDRDGIGDWCDPDRDGDGCQNAYFQPDGTVKPVGAPYDWHPDRAKQVVGYTETISVQSCAKSLNEILSPEANDSDRDGQPDCNDIDDDNDGLLDVVYVYDTNGAKVYDPITGLPVTKSEDPCPITPRDPNFFVGNPRFPGECTERFDFCTGSQPLLPFELPPDFASGLFVRFGQSVNPDPERDFLWDNVRLAGGQVILDPGAGTSVSQLTTQLQLLNNFLIVNRSRVRPAALPAPPEPFRVELWARGTNGGPAQLLSVLGDFDPAKTTITDGDTGALLALVPAGEFGGQVSLAGVWLDSQPAGSARVDTDLDGMPDGYEIRTGFNARDSQDGLADTDGDGRRNFEEFLAGTNPRAVDTVPLRLSVLTLPDGRLRLTWFGGTTIRLQRATDPSASNWDDVADTLGKASLELDSTGTTGFFRLARP